MNRNLGVYMVIAIVTACLLFSCVAIGEKASFSPDMQFEVSDFSDDELLMIKDTLVDWLKSVQIEIRNREKQNTNESTDNTDTFTGEIQFRNIPWGSNYRDAMTYLTDFSFRTRDEKRISSELDTAAEMILDPREKADVAGYDLSYVRLTLLYTVDDGTIMKDTENIKFVRAMYYLNALNKDEAYEDLKAKLSALYGEGVEESVTAGIATTWTADDGSYVQLENGYFAVEINYGIKGEVYESWLSEVLDEQKRQETENAEGNYNGL